MSILDELITVGIDLLTFKVYEVTVIVELNGVLIGKKTTSRLMTLRQIERLMK